MDADVIIAGAGLAGAAAALHLSAGARVLVLDADAPAAGASSAAAGLANPLMGRRARLAWRGRDALAALHASLDEAGAAPHFRPGLLRPARDGAQADAFRSAAADHPDLAEWLAPTTAAERHPVVRAPHGALAVHAGGAVDVPAAVRAWLAAARRRGAGVRTGARAAAWGEADGSAWVEVEAGDGGAQRLRARHVLLAVGYGAVRHPALAPLGLHGVKGQTARVRRPDGLDALPHLSGHGYVVADDDALTLGSTYEHAFDTLAPDAATGARLVARAARMVPALAGAEVTGMTAGVRVNVPGTRLPVLGPLPGGRRVWLFGGLGSKGLLMAPLLAQRMAACLRDPAAIPPEVRLATATG